MRAVVGAMLFLLATAANAQGFAVHDLTPLAEEMKRALGPDFVHRDAPQRVTLACPTCAGSPMVDVLLGRQDDGTEQRVRSGATSIARLRELCQAKDPACRLDALDIAPAVGWITGYRIGESTQGTTAVILRDGDLLTIRVLSSDPAIARATADRLVATVARTIIGR
jgi:hypothetical protein